MLHLLHPALVHVSVAFLILGSLTEAAGIFAGRSSAARFGGVLVLVGTASLLPALVSGYLAANTVEVPAAARGLLWAHERNGWIVCGLFAGSQLWKAWNQGELPPAQQRAYALLLLVSAAVVAYSAWLGAEMVYRHGVGVVRLP